MSAVKRWRDEKIYGAVGSLPGGNGRDWLGPSRGKLARVDCTRWLVGCEKGDKEGCTAQSRSNWAALAMDGTAMVSE